jgi:hypothetical protein
MALTRARATVAAAPEAADRETAGDILWSPHNGPLLTRQPE